MSGIDEKITDLFYKQEIHFNLDFFTESDELIAVLKKHQGTVLFDGSTVEKGVCFEYLLDFVILHLQLAKRPLGKYYKTYNNLIKSAIAHKRSYDKRYAEENIEEEKIPVSVRDDVITSFINYLGAKREIKGTVNVQEFQFTEMKDKIALCESRIREARREILESEKRVLELRQFIIDQERTIIEEKERRRQEEEEKAAA
jgi:hypothetical protein